MPSPNVIVFSSTNVSKVPMTDDNNVFTGTNTFSGAVVLNGALSGTSVKDEDNMASDSATAVSTQQATKAYIDAHASDTSTHGVTIVAGLAENQSFTGTNKFGSATNYLQIDSSGKLSLVGTATGWDDIVFEMIPSRRGALTKPDWDTTNLGFLFPQNDTTEYVDIVVQLPHRWKTGSTIFPHVHCVQSADQQAVMKLDYKWYDIGDAVPAGTTTYTMGTYAITYSSGSIGQILKNTTGIDGSGLGISSILKLRLYRDDNAYTGDILVDSFDIHIETDGFGSDEEYTK